MGLKCITHKSAKTNFPKKSTTIQAHSGVNITQKLQCAYMHNILFCQHVLELLSFEVRQTTTCRSFHVMLHLLHNSIYV